MTLNFTHEIISNEITLTRIFDYDLEANKVINYDDEKKFTVFIGEGMFRKSLHSNACSLTSGWRRQ